MIEGRILIMELVMDMYKGFRGDRLKSMRLKKDLSLDKCAELLGTNKSTLSRIENNKKPVDSEMFSSILELLGGTADYYMGRVEDPYITHSEYIDEIKKYHLIGGDMFAPDKLEELSQERFEALLKFARDQYRLNELEKELKENKDR